MRKLLAVLGLVSKYKSSKRGRTSSRGRSRRSGSSGILGSIMKGLSGRRRY
jgi:hypothetical protein